MSRFCCFGQKVQSSAKSESVNADYFSADDTFVVVADGVGGLAGTAFRPEGLSWAMVKVVVPSVNNLIPTSLFSSPVHYNETITTLVV